MTTTALPVRLALGSPDAPRVRDWVESVLGWQPVDDDETGLTPPSLALVDMSSTAPDQLPVVLLVGGHDDPVATARMALRGPVAEVIAWPDERDRLPEVAERVTLAPPEADSRGASLRIGGAAGGVGTTTVAVSLAGLVAWSGRQVLVVTRGNVPVRDVLRVPADALTAPTLWAQATRVPGVPGLRAVVVDRLGPDGVPTSITAETIVADVGVETDVDVLVGRRDTALLSALEHTCASTVVVLDQGVASPASITAAAAGRRVVTVGVSARVARAALSGRVPAAIPGRWLGELRTVLRRLP